jgi:acyl-CoA dehydrogenase family protein 9
MAVPEEFGGLGLNYNLYNRVFQEVGGCDGSVAVFIGGHQSIGYRALLNEGTEEQKKKWLPKLANGEMIASFCLTEPGAGSDAYSIKTKAVKNADGTFTINGQKLWITNAGTAKFYSVYCKTDVEIDGKIEEKITCFAVEKGTPGFSFGEKEKKLGIRASETRAIYFDNVVVPAENVIGEFGKGFKIAMNVLNSGRLSIGSGAVGGMKTILRMITDQAKQRKQFGKSIVEFGIIQDMLAKMAANIYAVESTVYFTTGKMINGMTDYSLESAICKIFGSEKLWETVNMGLQIAGGTGYMNEYSYQLMLRDSRIHLIFEGTNEILRCLIALAGMQAPSENLKELGKIADVSTVLSDPIKSLGLLTGFAKKRIGKYIPGKSLNKVHAEFRDEAEIFPGLLGEFTVAVENTLIKFGKKIVDNELPQKRIADMTIDLYVILAVLSRSTAILEDDSVPADKKEYIKNLTRIATKERRHSFMENLKNMNKNNDNSIVETSNQVCENNGYGLDILDF